MRRKTPILALLMLVAGGVSAALVSDLARDLRGAIEIASAEARRSEYHLRYRLGLPMPGMPDLSRLDQRLAAKGLSEGAPVLVRIFKQESELELWMQKGQRFELFATYPVCRWSGGLGPKQQRGDHQSPEGFYTVAASQLNPRSRWNRSFNVGYPNLLDRAHGRTGDFIMVHGGCSSVGCFAVTNEAVGEIWRLVQAALGKGQQRFQVQSFPFRLSEWNLALHRSSLWAPFWRDLAAGHDLFETTGIPPLVSVCAKRYELRPGVAGADGSAPIEAICNEKPGHMVGGS